MLLRQVLVREPADQVADQFDACPLLVVGPDHIQWRNGGRVLRAFASVGPRLTHDRMFLTLGSGHISGEPCWTPLTDNGRCIQARGNHDHLLLSNLEPGTTDDELRAFIHEYGHPPCDAFERVRGDGTHTSVVLKFNDLDPEALHEYAGRIHHIF